VRLRSDLHVPKLASGKAQTSPAARHGLRRPPNAPASLVGGEEGQSPRFAPGQGMMTGYHTSLGPMSRDAALSKEAGRGGGKAESTPTGFSHRFLPSPALGLASVR